MPEDSKELLLNFIFIQTIHCTFSFFCVMLNFVVLNFVSLVPSFVFIRAWAWCIWALVCESSFTPEIFFLSHFSSSIFFIILTLSLWIIYIVFMNNLYGLSIHMWLYVRLFLIFFFPLTVRCIGKIMNAERKSLYTPLPLSTSQLYHFT